MINLLSAILAALAFVALVAEVATKILNIRKGPDMEPDNSRRLYEIIVQANTKSKSVNTQLHRQCTRYSGSTESLLEKFQGLNI